MQLPQLDSRVELHGAQHIVDLIALRLKAGAHQMRPFNTTREAEDRSPCVRVPIRSAKAREGRHHIDAVRVRHALRKRRGACGIINKAQAFLEPLDERATHEHAAFERILEPFRARSRGRDGREQAMV